MTHTYWCYWPICNFLLTLNKTMKTIHFVIWSELVSFGFTQDRGRLALWKIKQNLRNWSTVKLFPLLQQKLQSIDLRVLNGCDSSQRSQFNDFPCDSILIISSLSLSFRLLAGSTTADFHSCILRWIPTEEESYRLTSFSYMVTR